MVHPPGKRYASNHTHTLRRSPQSFLQDSAVEGSVQRKDACPLFSSTEEKGIDFKKSKIWQQILRSLLRASFHAILRSFNNGIFDEDVLSDGAEQIAESAAESGHRQSKRANNVTAVRKFIEIGEAANPAIGTHKIIHQNARVPLDGVIVSARPEIITENRDLRYFAFTKLRFSKSKVSAEAQEIVLLVLMHYGQQQSYDGLSFSMQRSKLIDCFFKTVITGHSIGRHRYQQLYKALEEICAMWPHVSPR